MSIISSSQAQKSTFLSQPDISLDEIDQGIIYRELESAMFTMQENDTLFFFDPNGNYLEVDYCIGRECVRPETIENRYIGSGGAPEPSSFLKPLVMQFRDDRTQTGTYIISVRDKNTNEPRHLLKFNVVYPQPSIESVDFIDPSGKTVTDTLQIGSGEDLGDWRIRLRGSELQHGFSSVKVGSLELSPTSDPETFTFAREWNGSTAKRPGLGENTMVFNRKVSTVPVSKQFYITSRQPKVLGSNIEVPVEEGQSRVKIKLAVNNVFEFANVILYSDRRSPRLLASPYAFTAQNNQGEGTISFEMLIDPGRVTTSAYFQVAVKNIDQSISDRKTIRLIKKSDNILIKATDPNYKPLVAGTTNYMKIKRINGDRFVNGTYEVIFEGGQRSTFSVNNTEPDAMSIHIDLPPNITGEDIPVTLRSQNSMWKGSIAQIRPLPTVDVPDDNVVLRDSEFRLKVTNAKDVYLSPVKGSENGVSVAQPENKTIREFIVYVGKNANDFTLRLSLFDHVIKEIPFSVANHPSPRGFTVENIIRENIVKHNRVILTDTEDVIVSIPVDNDSILSSTVFYAQMYKKNGVPVRQAKPLRLVNRDGKEYLSATLNTQIGLEPGEEFDIELSNPDQESITINSYIRRDRRDNWIATAGLSAIDYRFGDTEEDESRVKVLDGVNIGVYYMPENLKNPSNRNLGVGFNLLLVGTEDSLDFRVGASALFFEKVVLGFSAGKDGLGFLAGVNIQLSNLSGLVGGG